MFKKIFTQITILSFVLAITIPQHISAATTKTQTKAQKEAMIKKSIQSYKGNCPCPYSTMKNGRSCGKTSAYSKPGGVKPFCYVSDIK